MLEYSWCGRSGAWPRGRSCRTRAESGSSGGGGHGGLLAGGTGAQKRTGLPVVPGGQWQRGTWLMTLQMAPEPHVPGHGSTQLKRMQARWREQSALVVHSRWGRSGSAGMHSATPFTTRHVASSSPHGFGSHGSPCCGGSAGGACCGVRTGAGLGQSHSQNLHLVSPSHPPPAWRSESELRLL